MLPYMTNQEIEFFDNFFKEHMTVFEWGCGGSTLRWAPKTRKWYSIEHDLKWCDKIYSKKSNNCFLFYADVNNEKYIEGLLSSLIDNINVFLIDGRRRIECAYFLSKNIRPGSLVFLHDAIRYNTYKIFDWEIDIIKGLKKGNHKGVRMHGNFI